MLRSAFKQIWAACDAAGKPVGVHATDGLVARHYRDAGCTLITTAADAAAITRGVAAELGTARGVAAELGTARS